MQYSTTLKGKIMFVVMTGLMFVGMLFMVLGVFSLNKSSSKQKPMGMDLDNSTVHIEDAISESDDVDAFVVEQDTDYDWTVEDDLVVDSYYTDNPIYYPEDYSSWMVEGIMSDTLGEHYEITVAEVSNPPTKLWGIINPTDGFYEVVEYQDDSLENYRVVLSAILDNDNYECNFYEY